jgi:hypothetical protein
MPEYASAPSSSSTKYGLDEDSTRKLIERADGRLAGVEGDVGDGVVVVVVDVEEVGGLHCLRLAAAAARASILAVLWIAFAFVLLLLRSLGGAIGGVCCGRVGVALG